MKFQRLLVLVFVIKWQLIQSVVISNVHFAFETFSPKTLIRFFEFNDFSYNISQFCYKDLYLYLDALQKDLRWSYRLFDASGNYAGGFLYGELLRLSNPRQCEEFNAELNLLISGISNKTTSNLNSTDIVPFFVQLVNAKYQTFLDNMKHEIYQTVCLPVSCSYDDLAMILSYMSLDPENVFLDNTELVEIRVLYQSYKFYTEPGFLIIAILASAIFLFTVGVSFHEIRFRITKQPSNEKYKKNISCHPEISLTGNLKSTNKENSSSDVDDKTKIVGKHDVVCKQHCRNKTKNFQMPEDAEKMTISSKNCGNHVNLVKLHKNKTENTITLDIISANMFPCQKKRKIDPTNIIHRFSLQYQLQTSLDTPFRSDSTPSVIPGIRAFSLFWMVLLNVTTFLSYVANNRKFLVDKETNYPIHLIFKNGSFAIDSFFFINGFLLCEIFFRSSKQLGVHNIKCVEKQIQHFFFIIMYKVLRIILPYTVLLQLLRIAMKYFNENSILSVPSNDHFTCDSLVKNLLFVDTFTETNERCGLFTWFISLEMLYFGMSLIVLMISRNHPRFGATIFTSFYISTFFISTANQVNANQFNRISDLNGIEKLSHLNGMFDGPLVYLGPYLVGILFGVCRFNYRSTTKVKINSLILAMGFTSSSILFALLTFGSFNLNSMNIFLKQSFLNMSHLFWGFILLWMCFVSISDIGDFLNGFFSSSFFQLISKISNSCLLIHPLILRIIVLGSNNPLFISVEFIVVAFFGLLTMTLLLGVLFHLLFEAPVLIFIQIAYEKLVDKMKK